MLTRVHVGLIALVLLNLFPASFLFSCTSLWGLDSGLSLAKVGLISITFLPNSFKFMWAPISDILKGRFKLDYSTITMSSSFLILLCMIWLSLVHPKKNFEEFFALLLFMNFLKSFIWDTIDGYRSQIFSLKEQKLATSIFMTTYRGGIMGITGLSIFAAKFLGWQSVLQIQALLMAILLVVSRRLLPASPDFSTKQQKFSLLSSFKGISNHMPIMLGIVMLLTYRFGDMWIFSYLTIFLKHTANMSTTDAGLLVQSLMPCSIAGIWIARKISDKISNYRLMYYTTIAHLVILAMLGSTVYYPSKTWLVTTIFFEEIISGFFFFTASLWMIQYRNPEYPSYSIATFSSLINIPTVFVGPATTLLVKHQGWFGFVEVPMITTFACIMVLQWYLRYSESGARALSLQKTHSS